ncbi:MAG: hypothetical protein QOF31_5649, partial [Mycobacterium sp.]|nr:hypothetical protein [Mycobacterium sp.]
DGPIDVWRVSPRWHDLKERHGHFQQRFMVLACDLSASSEN